MVDCKHNTRERAEMEKLIGFDPETGELITRPLTAEEQENLAQAILATQP